MKPLEVGMVLRLSSPPPWAVEVEGRHAFRVRVVYVGRCLFRGLVIASKDPLFVGQELEYSFYYWRNKAFVEDLSYGLEACSIEECM